MEFLRFGSSIPGEYWGCCAVDIIQNFKQDPDTKASIQLVSGDRGGGLTQGRDLAFLGPTLRDIFWQRLRLSTFSKSEMPNHGFIAILEHSQIQHNPGKKWLALLKEAGFEFIRTVDNSVYTGQGHGGGKSPHKNYIFGLFRNIGAGKVENPFLPPKEWTDLPTVAPEQWHFNEKWGKDLVEFADEQRQKHEEIWQAHGPTKIMTDTEVVEAGAPVIMAGLRSEFPPQFKSVREERMKQRKDNQLNYSPSNGSQFLY